MSEVAIEIGSNTVEVNVEVFKGYQEEVFGYLNAEAEAKKNFKEAVETVAETTGIDKKVLTKYFKAKYKAKTKEQSELGEVFAALDEATEAL